jgi:TonB family protein
LRLPKTPGHARASARWSFIAILFFALAPVAARGANPHISSLESEPSESHSLSGTIPTHPGLQLTVQADCGDVRIFTDAANEVSYSLHPHSGHAAPGTAATDPAALLADFSLSARQTPRGIEFIARALNESACRVPVIYEIHVPRSYSLNVAVQSGAITAQDIDGGVAFFTGGGEIRLGSVGGSALTTPTRRSSVFAARLESAGGNIFAGDIDGGLRATTGGGQIVAGDVRGPAVLRTGGGEIRVGHVFGAARLSSGGGNISASKIDGGIWAEADGGRVEIGNVPVSSAFAPEFSGGEGDALATSVLQSRSENEQVLPFGDAPDINRFARLFDAFFWGGIRVAPMEQQKHLVASVPPNYPEVARLAGIEGEVTLRLLIGEDGTVRDLRPVLGPPVLARAAMRAVEQWRYAPALVDGRPVDVVTTVTFAFHLR